MARSFAATEQFEGTGAPETTIRALSIWVNMDSLPLFGIGRWLTLGGPTSTEIMVLRYNAQSIEGYLKGMSFGSCNVVNGVPAAAEWHNYIFQAEDDVPRTAIYRDGSLIGTGSFTDGTLPCTDITIMSAGEGLAMKLAEGYVYSNFLDATERAAIGAGGASNLPMVVCPSKVFMKAQLKGSGVDEIEDINGLTLTATGTPDPHEHPFSLGGALLKRVHTEGLFAGRM